MYFFISEPSADEMLQNVLSKQAKEIAVNPDLLNEDARPSGSQTPGDTGGIEITCFAYHWELTDTGWCL